MASYFTSALMDMDSQLEVLESLQALAKNADIAESNQTFAKIPEEISANNLTSHISSSNAFDLKSSMGDYLNNVLQDSNEENHFSNVIYVVGSPSPNTCTDQYIGIYPTPFLQNDVKSPKNAKMPGEITNTIAMDVRSPLRLKSDISVGTDTNDISKSAQYSNNATSFTKFKKWWCLCK